MSKGFELIFVHYICTRSTVWFHPCINISYPDGYGVLICIWPDPPHMVWCVLLFAGGSRHLNHCLSLQCLWFSWHVVHASLSVSPVATFVLPCHILSTVFRKPGNSGQVCGRLFSHSSCKFSCVIFHLACHLAFRVVGAVTSWVGFFVLSPCHFCPYGWWFILEIL